MTYKPDFAVHPGKSLEEIIEKRYISLFDLCNKTGYSKPDIVGILVGSDDITKEIAIKLEKALGHPPASFWMNLQKNYDETVERIENGNNN